MRYVAKELKETADISRGRKPARRIFEYAVGLAALGATVYFALILIANALAIWIPDRWEARLGSKSETNIGEDDDLAEARDELASMLSAIDTRALSYRVSIIEQSEPNAFAVPGGHIILTRGLFEAIRNRKELAFVIAHELAHHEQRHTLKRFLRHAFFRGVWMLMFGGDFDALGSSVTTLSESSYSRKQELAADRYAFLLLREELGIEGDFYEILLEIDPARSDGAIGGSYVRSHPFSDERIAALVALEQARP